MQRVELAKIPSLTFYKDEYTTARRTSRLRQLVCAGKPCKSYQPEAVRCVNIGGSGTDVDWKCEADLPESLRFGKVEVSCEGWSAPGDPYVLKGSCSLEYRLVQVPGALRNDEPIFGTKRFSEYDWSSIIFAILWIGLLFFFAYNFFLSCFRNRANSRPSPPPNRPSGSNRGTSSGGGGGGWFPGSYGDESTPPPPYSKNPPGSGSTASGWTPGFWSGAALGTIGNQLWNRYRGQTPVAPAPAPSAQYDWERPRSSFWGSSSPGTRRQPVSGNSDDRGEGSSNLGPTRRSTGFGRSNVR